MSDVVLLPLQFCCSHLCCEIARPIGLSWCPMADTADTQPMPDDSLPMAMAVDGGQGQPAAGTVSEAGAASEPDPGKASEADPGAASEAPTRSSLLSDQSDLDESNSTWDLLSHTGTLQQRLDRVASAAMEEIRSILSFLDF